MDPTDELAQVPQFTKIRSIICASICNFMIGAYYFFSNINIYVASYLKQNNDGLTPKDTLLIMPIYIVMQSLGTILSIKLSARFGYPMVSIVSYAVFSLASLFMVFTTGYWTFVLLYGVIAGLAIGIGYMPALIIAWTYYPDKKSIVTGVCLFTAGISASILSPMSTAIVNPDNLSDYETNPAVFGRVPFLFFCLFLLYGGMTLVGAFLQPPPFESKAIQELKELKELDEANKIELAKEQHHELEVVNGSIHSKEKHSSLHHAQPQEDGVLTQEEFKKAIQREIEQDKNFQSGLIGDLPAEDLAKLVITKKSVQVLIRDQKESLRQSIRASMNRQSFRNSIARFKGLHNNLANPEVAEKHARDLLVSPAISPEQAQKDKQIRESINRHIKQEHIDCPGLGYALASWPYWSLALMAYSCSIYNYFMNSVWKQFYVTKIIVSDKQMALILSYGAFANSIVRVVSGFAMMKYDFKYIYLLLVSSTILCCFTINSFLENYIIGAIYSMTVFGGIGIQVTIFPTVCTKVFGQTVGPKVFPFVFSFFSLANLTQYFILKFTEDWGFMFWLFGVIACGGLALGFLFTSSPDWREAQSQFHANKIREEQEALKKELLPNAQ
jgi:MFS family permease